MGVCVVELEDFRVRKLGYDLVELMGEVTGFFGESH